MRKNFGPVNPAFPHFLHGGDYNPDQWMHIPGIWEEDMRLMKLANCNAMSVGIFSWAKLEPREGHYEFEWLDRVMDMLAENGGRALLATPSGSKPAWLSLKYPEICRMNDKGLRDKHGWRHNHCLTSPVYRAKTQSINRKLAERYKGHPALLLWHISNEYGGECRCDLCHAAFRTWLRRKYPSLEALNQAWWSAFWSHTFGSWEEIASIDGSMHGMVLDWKRFVTDQTIDFYLNEIAPLREITPEIPITTNLMGWHVALDYWKLAKHLDVVSWDSYPSWHSNPEGETALAVQTAFDHDLNRSLKGGRPFMLMESTPSATNWMAVGCPKRPGMHILTSLQAVAHGSDTVQYFQWRKSRGSFEKFHGAVVDHAGHENTRIFKEVSALGGMLKKLEPVLGTTVKAEVAIVYDWENRWGIEESQGPRNEKKNYIQRCVKHYEQFWRRGIPVDIVNEDSDFSSYKLLIAPMLYMVREGVAPRIEDFVRRGGVFVTTYLSGVADANDLCFLGGFPGPLRSILGVRIEETDILYDHQAQSIMSVGANPLGLKGPYKANHYAEIVHVEGAQVLAVYQDQFYAGHPALTVNALGAGEAYLIASRNEDRFLTDFYDALALRFALRPILSIAPPEGVSVQERTDGERTFVFVLNFSSEPRRVELGKGVFFDLLRDAPAPAALECPGYGVAVLERK